VSQEAAPLPPALSPTTPAVEPASAAKPAPAPSVPAPAKPEPKVDHKDKVATELKVEPKTEPKLDSKAAPKPEEKASTSAKAQALLDGKEPAKPAVAVPRYTVQVGAFSDLQKAHEARITLEKAGIKTYTQVVTTADGKRTRVRAGPWEDKAEAEKTAEKIKKLNLPAAILTL